MKIIDSSVELIETGEGLTILEKIEKCARVCYQSSPRGNTVRFVKSLIKR